MSQMSQDLRFPSRVLVMMVMFLPTWQVKLGGHFLTVYTALADDCTGFDSSIVGSTGE